MSQFADYDAGLAEALTTAAAYALYEYPVGSPELADATRRLRGQIEKVLRERRDAAPSYHDLHITTAHMPRTSIFNMPYGYEVSCNRVGGWGLWLNGERVAGEYDAGLRLDVAGHVICDSLTRVLPPEVTP